MKRLIIAALAAFTLAGCAEPMHKVTLAQADMDGMQNDTVVMCAYAGDLPPRNGVLESDPNGFCKREAAARLKDGRMTEDEFKLDLASAQGQLQQATQIAVERAQENAADERRNNNLMILSAICSSRPWGC